MPLGDQPSREATSPYSGNTIQLSGKGRPPPHADSPRSRPWGLDGVVHDANGRLSGEGCPLNERRYRVAGLSYKEMRKPGGYRITEAKVGSPRADSS
ncbi:hypothetical protein GCM10022394_16790 [Zobellella aerophila]|uniref:Prealbumin-like fold domain-containing protein n=1 Tax=Zobellella aerophila TaxID=870480 RepID=A0ABP6VMR3_9GAMM